MADNDKTSQIKLDFLNTLYNLILSEDIKEEERRVLTKAKNLVEKGEYYNGFGWNRLPKSFMSENTVFLLLTALIHNFYKTCLLDTSRCV